MAHPPYGSAQKGRIRSALCCVAVILRRFLCQGSKSSDVPHLRKGEHRQRLYIKTGSPRQPVSTLNANGRVCPRQFRNMYFRVHHGIFGQTKRQSVRRSSATQSSLRPGRLWSRQQLPGKVTSRARQNRCQISSSS